MADPIGIVRLNVGGHEYTTSRSTLQKVTGSMLARLLETDLNTAQVNGATFIDRDGQLFGFILEYLRNGVVELPDSVGTLRRLEREAEFFILPDLQLLVRAKLLQVCVEVRMFAEPFGCSEEECKCGSNRLANLDAFDDNELEAMSEAAMDDDLDHPRKTCWPSFDTPFAITHLRIKTELPRDASQGQVIVHPGATMPGVLRTLAGVLASVESGLHGRMNKCKGSYKADGSCNEHTKYKNASGAVIYYSDGKWRMNFQDDTNGHLFCPEAACVSTDKSDDNPPQGTWTSQTGYTMLVESVDFPRPNSMTMLNALQSIKSDLINCEHLKFGSGFGVDALSELLEPIPDVLRSFVEQPCSSRRELYLKTCGYAVGDRYLKKRQRHHFGACVKLEFETQAHSQCKRWRLDQSIHA